MRFNKIKMIKAKVIQDQHQCLKLVLFLRKKDLQTFLLETGEQPKTIFDEIEIREVG